MNEGREKQLDAGKMNEAMKTVISEETGRKMDAAQIAEWRMLKTPTQLNAVEAYSRILSVAHRLLSANQESQPREYHAAMSELEKIVSQSDSPLDTDAGSDQGRGQNEPSL